MPGAIGYWPAAVAAAGASAPRTAATGGTGSGLPDDVWRGLELGASLYRDSLNARNQAAIINANARSAATLRGARRVQAGNLKFFDDESINSGLTWWQVGLIAVGVVMVARR